MTIVNSPTMIQTIDAALETAQIINRILADETMSYKEKHELIDSILATPAKEVTA